MATFFLFLTEIEHLVQRHPPFRLYGFELWAGLLFEIQAVGQENVRGCGCSRGCRGDRAKGCEYVTTPGESLGS